MEPMAETTRTMGMIAGKGIYPETFAREAKARGVRLVATAFKGETSPDLESMVDEIAWMRVGQVGKMLKFFAGAGVTEAVMVGQVAPGNLQQRGQHHCPQLSIATVMGVDD